MQTYACIKNVLDTYRSLYLVIALVLLASAPVLAWSNYSIVGAAAAPAQAHTGDLIGISFRVHHVYWSRPPIVTVTVNGHAVSNLRMTSSYPEFAYVCDYRISSPGADKDGHAAISISVNGASSIHQTFTDLLLIDNSPPLKPSVTDGDAFTTLTSLHATWISSDPQSGVIAYQYAVGTSPGSADTLPWTTPTPAGITTVTTPALPLLEGKTYYFAVKAENGAGLWSEVGTSDGVAFDDATPTTPVVTDDGDCTESTRVLRASWSSTDPGGVAEYQYTIGTSPTDIGCGYLIPWTSAGRQTKVTVNQLTLHPGWTYYFYVKARGAVGKWSAVGVSDGIEAGVRLVPKDYLAGIGEFDWSPETRWYSNYTGPDFHPVAGESNYEWIEEAFDAQNNPTGWWGYDSPAPNDTVGVGWWRTTYGLNPSTNIEYDLVDAGNIWNGVSGKCQYFAVKDIPSVSPHVAYAELGTQYNVPVNNADPDMLHSRDHVAFTIDKVKITGADNLPSGTFANYRVILYYGPNWGAVTYTIPHDATSVSLSLDIPDGATWVTPNISIQTNGNFAGNKPSIYLKGAHLTATRDGRQIEVESRYCQIRTIKTSVAGFLPWGQDAYRTATDCDWAEIYLSPYAPSYAQQFRSVNPNMKVYLYETADFTDQRDPTGQDMWNRAPIPFGWTLSNETEWLCPDGSGGYCRDSYYPTQYYAQFTNPDFETQWANNTASQLGQYHLDGVFIDACNELPPESLPPNGRDGWECEKFLHAVVPTIKSITWSGEQTPRRMQVVLNASYVNTYDPNRTPPYYGAAMWDPTWQGTPPYLDNTFQNTPDSHYNESSFWGFNVKDGISYYNRDYWLRCLADMDLLSTWNADNSYASDDPKCMDCQAEGTDTPNNPAYGSNGWIQFGLCSYLLAQNAYTTFGVANNFVPDYDITKDYPAAAGPRYQISPASQYLLARDYYGDDGGARGGTVVANGDSAAHTYVTRSDVVDENNTYYPYGASISIGPNKGKLFFNPSCYRYVSVITTPGQNQAIAGSPYTVVGFVRKNRAGLDYPSDVQISIDEGAWIDCPVNSQSGYFYYVWPSTTLGTHTLRSRVYVNSRDYEPEKPPVVCTR